MSDRPFIVVIDDDQSIRKALRRLLWTAQMEVETYSSGEKFLRADLGREPDCLVVDVRMPGMTGPDLRDQLLDVGRRIPIIFITAHEDPLPSVHGALAGFAEVLRKPFDEKALLDAIDSAIARREAS
jgi:FixJ family two-component response regulator